MPRPPAYGSDYRRRVLALRSGPPVLCAHCRRRPATTLDHDPPLAMHVHRSHSQCCRLLPSCEECNREGGSRVLAGTWRPGAVLAGVEDELRPERDGLPERDRRYRRSWIPHDRPADATWPRLMTVPHPRAVGSLGGEFAEWAADRTGRELRWWQRLVAARVLEIDREGRLVWETAIVSTARQVGKSWLLRELCLWRMHQGERFGEPQDVLHTGKDVNVCKEVQRAGRVWAKQRPDLYKVREVNGQEEIERLADGSRWMLRAREAVYGYSASLGAVDEAWKVRAATVDEGLTPTMAEREQAQLILTSTAHRMATALMLDRRSVALQDLETGLGDLLIEWSAPRDVDTADRGAWRQASPHWSDRREKLVAGAHERMSAGEIVDDPDEPDPIESFKSQWLNVWPARRITPTGPTEPLLPDGAWDGLREELAPAGGGAVWVGLEDDFGLGAAVACARRLPDGRVEIDGWLRPSWDEAVADLVALRGAHTIRRVLTGPSIFERLPPGLVRLAEPRSAAATRMGLALFRDLVLTGGIVHDVVTGELDETIRVAVVREHASGLFLVARGPTHLIRAAVWAVAAAHRPSPVPAIR